jgi:hypothetical protein
LKGIPDLDSGEGGTYRSTGYSIKKRLQDMNIFPYQYEGGVITDKNVNPLPV